MALTHNVEILMVKPSVLVCQDISDLLQRVDPNALLVMNALKTKLATTKNVWTLVQAHAESMPSVKLLIITRSAVVRQDTLVIPSSDVKLKLFNKPHQQILVSHHLVDQMLYVGLLVIKLHALAYQRWLEILHTANLSASVTQSVLVTWLA